MNNTRKISLESRVSQKNPYDATGSCDNTPTSQNKSEISTIKAYFGKISQDKPNFTARVSLLPAQKISFLGGVG
jgi:hypothetical protein